MKCEQRTSKNFYTNFEHNCGCEEKKCPDHTKVPTCEKCSEPAKMIAVRSLCIDHMNEAMDKKKKQLTNEEVKSYIANNRE